MGERAELHAPDEGHNTGLPKAPDAPQDPWLAVQGDQPKRRVRDQWTVRDSEFTCTAAHDHCLEADTWILVRSSDLERNGGTGYVSGSLALFGPEGPLYAANAHTTTVGPDYVAFHTVPATKANLVPGAIVFGLARPTVVPMSEADAAGLTWQYGVVESVDLDVGVYKAKGYPDTSMVQNARVAVLKWVPGGKVEIIGGKPRSALAVRAADVFLPEN